MRVTQYKILQQDNKLPYLAKEKSFNYPGDRSRFDSPSKIVLLLNKTFLLNRLTDEYVYLLALDTKLHLLGIFEMSHGTAREAIISTKSVFERALLCGATTIIVVHNHPSGDTTPSKQDFLVCKRLLEAGKLLDIEMVDFIIVGDNYTSFREHSFFDIKS